MAGPHHRTRRYRRDARALIDAANDDPATVCARCGTTIDQCGPNGDGLGANGRPVWWTAGHVNAGEIDGPLQPECSWSNSSAGGQMSNRRRREPRSSDWW